MKRTFLAVACLFVIAFGLAACGSDDSETTETAAMTEEQSETMANEPGTIVAVAQDTPDLSTLVDAVVAADLAETLEGPGPYTVFAPTNAAFESLGETLDTLLEPENQGDLANILTYHVVAGEAASSDLSDGQMIETVQGDSLEVTITDGNVMINGATVVMPDVEASNGVVHVIDQVLTP